MPVEPQPAAAAPEFTPLVTPEVAQAIEAATLQRAVLPRRRVLVLGDLAHCLAGATLFGMMKALRVELTDDLDSDYCCAIKWSPWSAYQIPPEVRARVRTRIINDTHFHCAKRNVEACFAAEFGYGTHVDPTRHQGPMAVKSNRNAVHDGRVIQGPISAEALAPDCIYQRLVANEVGHGATEDLRVVVMGRRLPVVVVKYRSLDERFSTLQLHARAVSPRLVMTEDEITRTIRFTQRLGLEYGELDALRDGSDGRLYIVDANNTPYGPAKRLPPPERAAVASMLGGEFLETFAAGAG